MTQNSHFSTLPARRAHDFIAALVMSLAVIATYWPPRDTEAGGLSGADFADLHIRRMSFAREAILEQHRLPAWYSRELLGTPFWANIQNFPFIPNRLLVLLCFDPEGPNAYAFAVSLAAVLAALATFAYCRAMGLGALASSAAGWTFACSGYFASRICAGHLPLLEAYFGLPLLLWLVEKERSSGGKWTFLLGLGCGVLMLAGHPQIPIYSIVTAGLYALWRGASVRRRITSMAAMVAGVGCAAFALVPMAMLVARSTRVLPLDRPDNDIAMPYGRLLGFWLPWRDGAAPPLPRFHTDPFRGYQSLGAFWDTVCYIGWMPWLAVGGLMVWLMRRRQLPAFLLLMGIAGIVLALPIVQSITSKLPGTFLRSPARLVYLTELALAIALGAGIQALLNVRPRKLACALIACVLAIHAIDLVRFERAFLLRAPRQDPPDLVARQRLRELVGDGRVGMDHNSTFALNRKFDDVGFFDSIMLARSYQGVLDLAGAPEGYNTQYATPRGFRLRALRLAGVRFLIQREEPKPGVTYVGDVEGFHVFALPSPSPRAEFFPADRAVYLDRDAMRKRLRDPQYDPTTELLLPSDARVATAPSKPGVVEYRRPDSDHVDCTVTADGAGFLRVTESWDPGWSATVNGVETKIWPAMDFLLAVPVSAGKHEVRFVYQTPGATVGIVLSLLSLAGLIGLSFRLPAKIARR